MSQVIGERIRWARERQGVEQADLGKALGQRDGTTVSKWENGERRPSTDAVVGIVRELGVNAHWLLTGEGEPWALPGEAERVLAEVRALVTARSPAGGAEDADAAEAVVDDEGEDPPQDRGEHRGVGG